MATNQRVPGVVSSATPPFPTYHDVLTLATASAESWTVPTDAKWGIITVIGDAVWANSETTATVPTDVSDGTGSMLLPVNSSLQIGLPAGGAISFIRNASTQAVVQISCWNA